MTKIVLKIINENQLNNIQIDYTSQRISNNFCNFGNELNKSVDLVETNLNFISENFYIFPISYCNESHFEEDLWFEFVNKFINYNYNFLTQKNVCLCICDFYESSKNLVKNAEHLLNKFNINILIISTDKKIKSTKIKIIYNDTWIKRFEPYQNIINYKPKKIYINLTRVARYHRCLLADKLIDNNLLEHGYNSWGDVYKIFGQYKAHNPNTKIDTTKFDEMDIADLSSINPNYLVPEKFCRCSFLYLSTETSIDNELMLFSEKTYKPIGIGMPFITLGNPGTLQDLQNRGFITFGDWFDESYDLDIPLENRIQIIINNLKKYSKYTKLDLISIRNEMSEILDHNLKLYTILRRKNFLKENLRLAVENMK